MSKILLAGLVGTTLMTAFGYVVGQLCGADLMEPKLLNKFLDRSKRLGVEVADDSLWGWLFHYLGGFLFAGAMAVYFCLTNNDLTWWWGIILGGILGLFGILGWVIMIRFHSSPVKIEPQLFFLQLIGAHVVFGLSVVFIFQLWASWY